MSCDFTGHEPEAGEVRQNVDIGARVPAIDVTQLRPLQVEFYPYPKDRSTVWHKIQKSEDDIKKFM